jgi:PAS domain S-box-containing protein
MKLFYASGACSLSPHIVASEAGIALELQKVDLKTKTMTTQGDYLAINPKGYVPALQLDNGELLTEGPAIVQYLADLKPQTGLAPPAGTLQRYRLQEMLGYINSELHKSYSPLFNPATPAEIRTEREAYLRAVLDNVGEGIVTIDQNGRLQSMNREALHIFGYAEQDILGSHFSELVPVAERDEYARFLKTQLGRLKGRMSGTGLEVNGQRQDGTIFPMELSLSTMTFGVERGFIAITRDVTARRRSEGLKGEIVAAVSHELRTPLAAALGSLGLLAETVGLKLSGDDERLLKIARNNLDRLARSVNELLDLDDSCLASMKRAPTPVLLTCLVEEAVAADADYAGSRDVRLSVDPCSAPALVQGDKSLLLRALSHIITNAVHLSPPHNTVELAVSCEDGRTGVISIRDCGIPVPREARADLFNAQANLSAFGIVATRGLHTARMIVERHGGSVGYEPREAGGSHFFFQLPLFVAGARKL